MTGRKARYIIQIGREYAYYSQRLANGKSLLLMTPYRYDAGYVMELWKARQICRKIGGVIMEFDPISGSVREA